MAKLLLLGGTAEARILAERAENIEKLDLLTSLAGRTSAPRPLPGKIRYGGFGGVPGMIDFFAKQKIDLVIDATHPFAAIISKNTVKATEASKLPMIRLERPAWEPEGSDLWRKATTLEEAAQHLPQGAKAMLTIGRQDIEPFVAREDCHFLIRSIEPPDLTPLPGHCKLLLSRGPFTPSEEEQLMLNHSIEFLIAKNSGGPFGISKLEAAKRLALPVIMIERPLLEPAPVSEDVEGCLSWILDHL